MSNVTPGRPDVLTRYFNELWNERREAVADEIFAPGFVFHAPIIPEGVRGAQAYRDRVMTPLLTAFPDLHFTLGERVESGEHVALAFQMTGTHLGQFEGIPATGRRFAVPGVVMARVSGASIEEIRGVFDGIAMLHQLGIWPRLLVNRQ